MIVVATGALGHPVGQREVDTIALIRPQEKRVRRPIAVFDPLDMIVERVDESWERAGALRRGP